MSDDLTPCRQLRPSSRREHVSASKDTLGSDGAPGHAHVVRLAESLVDVRNCPGMTKSQVSTIVKLWGSLTDRDKRRIQYSAQHKTQVTSGFFC